MLKSQEEDFFGPALRLKYEAIKPRFGYEIRHLVGRGNNIVKLAVGRDTEEKMAVKLISIYADHLKILEKSAEQFLTVSNLRHPNIVRHIALDVLGMRDSEPQIAIFMEYCAGGWFSLRDFPVRDMLHADGVFGRERILLESTTELVVAE